MKAAEEAGVAMVYDDDQEEEDDEDDEDDEGRVIMDTHAYVRRTEHDKLMQDLKAEFDRKERKLVEESEELKRENGQLKRK
jgi:hypothetical protein